MKFRCYCHYEDYNRITKEEGRSMLRADKRLEIVKFVDYYNIPLDEISRFMRARGMDLTYDEKRSISRSRYQTSVETSGDEKPKGVHKSSYKIMSYNVSEWPIALVCAIENVDYDSIKGKRSYDLEEYGKARDKIQNKIDNYFSDKETIQENGLKISKTDLIAMRYYRGVNRQEMAKKLVVNKKDVVDMESAAVVPKEVSDAYRKMLNIKDSHIYQLRKIMQGKLKKIEDNRNIPGKIKVAVYSRDKGRCSECSSKENLHYHHIVYFSEGGQNTVSNLKLLCAACHAEVHRGERSYPMLKKMSEKE